MLDGAARKEVREKGSKGEEKKAGASNIKKLKNSNQKFQLVDRGRVPGKKTCNRAGKKPLCILWGVLLVRMQGCFREVLSVEILSKGGRGISNHESGQVGK